MAVRVARGPVNSGDTLGRFSSTSLHLGSSRDLSRPVVRPLKCCSERKSVCFTRPQSVTRGVRASFLRTLGGLKTNPDRSVLFRTAFKRDATKAKQRVESLVPFAATTASDTDSVGDMGNDWDDEKEPSGMRAGEPRQLSVAEHYLHQRPHWRHWYGLYTIWDATTGGVVDTYRMERYIDEVEAPGVKIVHNNIRHKPAGREVNGPWLFDADASRPDGIAHPASPDFRSHQGPGGDFAYHFQEVPEDPGKQFRVEFFFIAPGKDTRASVLAYYNEQGDACWVICNRENDWDPNEKPGTWSSSNATAHERLPPPGKLTGVEYTLTTDLCLSEMMGTWKGYEHPVGKRPAGESLPGTTYCLLHLPDGLSIFFPRRVRRGMGAFQMSMHWQIDARTVRQETVVYGADGRFENFRVAHYT